MGTSYTLLVASGTGIAGVKITAPKNKTLPAVKISLLVKYCSSIDLTLG
jgi:hypothetical protein